MFIITGILMYVVAVSTENEYKIKLIDNSPGIYYDNLGPIKMYESTWNLVTHYNVTFLGQRIDYLEKLVIESQSLCGLASKSGTLICRQSLGNLNKKIPSIRLLENSLSEMIGHSQNQTIRSKRSYLDVIGHISKTLFGTLDSDDAKYYDDAIEKVTNDDKNIFQLLRDQTLVVSPTIKNFNQTISHMQASEKIFNDNIMKFNNYSQTNTNKVRQLGHSKIILDHFSSLSYFCNDIEIELNTIINSILFAKQNIIHHSIITPSQFIEELRKTLPYIPKTLEFPYPIMIEHAHELLNIVELNVIYRNGKIIFVISNPLTSGKEFLIYHLLPLPVQRGKSSIFINPNHKYLIMSTNKTQYTYMDEITNCKLLTDGLRLCKGRQPLYTTHSRPSCEADLLISRTIPKTCNIMSTEKTLEIWYKLNSVNEWLFTLSKEEELTLSCENKNQDILIQGTGIIYVNPRCRGYTPSITLNPKFTNKSDFDAIIPQINLLDDDCCNDKIINDSIHIPLLNPINHVDAGLEDLNLISHKLESFSQRINNIYNQPEIKRKISFFTYAGYVIGALFILYGTYKLYKCFKPCLRPAATLMIEQNYEEDDHTRQGSRNNFRPILTNIIHCCKTPDSPTLQQQELHTLNPVNDQSGGSTDNHSTSLRRSQRLRTNPKAW